MRKQKIKLLMKRKKSSNEGINKARNGKVLEITVQVYYIVRKVKSGKNDIKKFSYIILLHLSIRDKKNVSTKN